MRLFRLLSQLCYPPYSAFLWTLHFVTFTPFLPTLNHLITLFFSTVSWPQGSAVKTTKCFTVAGEEWTHKESLCFSLLYSRSWWGGGGWGRRFLGVEDKHLKRWALGDTWKRKMSGKTVRGSALAVLLLLVTWFIWCPLGCFSTQVLDCKEQKIKGRTLLFPPLFSISSFLFYYFLFLKA